VTGTSLGLPGNSARGHRALLCAADIAGTAPSLDLAARLTPHVPGTDPARYQADPWRALFD
jgi:hypothetical protein